MFGNRLEERRLARPHGHRRAQEDAELRFGGGGALGHRAQAVGRSASAKSAGTLTLKKGSIGASQNSTWVRT